MTYQDKVNEPFMYVLGIVRIRKYYKIAIVPSIIMLVFIVMLVKYVGIMVPVGALIAIFCARYLYKRGKI